MEDLLEEIDQWIVVNKEENPDTMTDEDWNKSNKKAHSTIRLILSDSVLLNVSNESIAHKLWNRIGEIYQMKSLINKLFMKRKLYFLK